MPVSGANQSGASIAASGGSLPPAARATAAPRLTRPQPKWLVHCSSGVAQAPPLLVGVAGATHVGGAPGSGTPVPAVLGWVTRSAVCSRISRVSSGLGVIPWSIAALTTSAAAPEALPVLAEPVVPSIEIELWPPYWVVLAPRKYVCGGAALPSPRPAISDLIPVVAATTCGGVPAGGIRDVLAEADRVGHRALHRASRGCSCRGSCGCRC